MRKQCLLLLTGMLILLVGSCRKEVRAEVVTVRDTIYVHDTTFIPALLSDTTTTLIVLRHAERESSGTDPGLTSAGIARAGEMVRLLSNVQVAAIYSTPFNRTKQTVQPLASAKGMSISEYDPNKPYAGLLAEITAANRGRVVVIVGHSNTVPALLGELSGNSFNITIDEDQYDNLFIVSLPDGITPSITHLKYGVATP